MKSQFNSNTKVIFNIIAMTAIGLFASGLKAQPFNINTLKAHASWSFGGNDRVVFESHSIRTIARYDSFVPALLNFFEDAEKSNLNLDSLVAPVQMHYLIFKDGKRKLTIENPEYSAKEFDLEKEVQNNNDSLPANLVEIHDVKHQMNIKIHVGNPTNLNKLKDMAIQYRDSIGFLSLKDRSNPLDKTEAISWYLAPIIKKIEAIPRGCFDHLYLNYFMFCMNLKEFIEPNERQTTYGLFIPTYSYEYNAKKLTERVGYSYEDPIEPFVWSHAGIGLMDKNLFLHQNIEFSLFTHFKNDLPTVKFYTNLGLIGFTEQQNSNSNQLELNSGYETLLGFKLNNLTPNIKSEKDFRVVGFELGLFFKDESSNSTLLPTSGYVFKCYKQWGNFRLNGGIYQSKSSVAGFITIEIYDFFHRHGYVSRD